VGSLTRTVEYLQLTVEQESSERQPLCQPYRSVDMTQDWTELEERRRVFWNVFSLDRFCSVTMGWNTSLTSDDVNRRLPCDGILWRKQEPVATPYFGIWDKSAGRIGNPMAFMPADHQSPDQLGSAVEMRSQTDGSASGVSSSAAPDMSTVGAYAYGIEATESMSRVTSYFLQQKINVRDQKEIGAWLTRFKELDLRLVHWKMLLPQKWKSNMSHHATNMDPNLTKAHITHNASMILLHQIIAYPPTYWGFRNKLPSSCSAETCYSAGVEIATITENYLRTTPKTLPISPQFSFCVYIAARMFLIHWSHHREAPLGAEFWSLVQSLEKISARWNGAAEGVEIVQLDLAAKYAFKLREFYKTCVKDESHHINVSGYTNEIDHRRTYNPAATVANGQTPKPIQSPTCTPRHSLTGQTDHDVSEWAAYAASGSEARGQPFTNGYVPPPSVYTITTPIAAEATAVVNGGNGAELNGVGIPDFNGIPQMLMDQHFMKMDRVITFDDGNMFVADLDGGGW
jgi:hypothetical protein